MKAARQAREQIEADPTSRDAKILSRLVVALETLGSFPLADLYELSYSNFDLALKLMAEWRLDRYYVAKGRLLDVSLFVLDADTFVHDRKGGAALRS